ncbi:MAG TPA: hypothetical protein VK304_13440 [Thermoleophilaceae bacterium]|nr:hypothetical protein [Thermoleophilaceae bacterium]
MARRLREALGQLSLELRTAAAAAVLLVASTFGPFSWIEAAIVLTGLSVLFLLWQRGTGKTFRLPEGDGTLVAVAGGWAGLLIVIRLLDRPLGQNLLALACAALLVAAGARERARRREPPEDAEHPVDPADAPTTPIR